MREQIDAAIRIYVAYGIVVNNCNGRFRLLENLSGILWIFSPAQKNTRFFVYMYILQYFEADGNLFFDKIITGDETWVHYYTLLSKRASFT